jgi:anti-anti-sigma factor
MIRIENKQEKIYISFNGVSKIGRLETTDFYSKISSAVVPSTKQLFISFQGIKFIDSTGFNSLTRLHSFCKKNNCELIIKNISDELMELFQLLKLDDQLNIIKN